MRKSGDSAKIRTCNGAARERSLRGVGPPLLHVDEAASNSPPPFARCSTSAPPKRRARAPRRCRRTGARARARCCCTRWRCGLGARPPSSDASSSSGASKKVTSPTSPTARAVEGFIMKGSLALKTELRGSAEVEHMGSSGTVGLGQLRLSGDHQLSEGRAARDPRRRARARGGAALTASRSHELQNALKPSARTRRRRRAQATTRRGVARVDRAAARAAPRGNRALRSVDRARREHDAVELDQPRARRPRQAPARPHPEREPRKLVERRQLQVHARRVHPLLLLARARPRDLRRTRPRRSVCERARLRCRPASPPRRRRRRRGRRVSAAARTSSWRAAGGWGAATPSAASWAPTCGTR